MEVYCPRCQANIGESDCYSIVTTTSNLSQCLECDHGMKIAKSCSVWDSLRIGRMVREREKEVKKLKIIFSKISA